VTGAVIFEKRAGKYDALLAERGGKLEEIPCPKQRPIPHDMFHVAVESVMQKRGFAHRVADGEGAGFRMTPEAVGETVERLVETMQADGWSGRPPASDVVELFATTCAARGDTPFPLLAEDVEAIRAEIDRLAGQWAALPERGQMRVVVG